MKAGAGGEPAFVQRLAGFLRFLLHQGFPVGTGAALDFASALREIPILDRETVLAVCVITLAKSPEEVSRLRDLFDVYWSSYIEPSEGPTRLAVSAPQSPPPDGVVPAAESTPAMRVAVDARGVVRVGLYSPDAPSAGHVVSALDRRRLFAIRAGVRRLRRFVATRPGRHRRPARRGTIDFPATARHSLRQGGEWVRFRFERRAMRRADLFVLWDVSGSMKEHEATAFAVVHGLLGVVRRTRVFAFGTRLDEITALLPGRSYAHATRTVAESLRPMGGGTRIGPCLEDFLRRYGRFVHDGTTLVILSDGWDLGDTARLSGALRLLRRLSHLIVWVNPYADDPRFEPATAGMREALPHVDLLLGPRAFEDRRAFPGTTRPRPLTDRGPPDGKTFSASM